MRGLENKNKRINKLYILLLKEKEMYQSTKNKEPSEVVKNKKSQPEELKKRKWYDILNA